MNDRERAICARVKRFREDIKWPQEDFAKAINFSRNQLANVEYARAPLRVGMGVNICGAFNANGEWLAVGKGLMHGGNPMLTAVKFGPEWYSQLLSQAYDEAPDIFIPPSAAPTHLSSEATPNFDPQAFLIKNIVLWFQMNKFKDSLEAENFVREICGYAETYLGQLRSMGIAARNIRSESKLTQTATSGNLGDVKQQWPQLKRQIQKATSEPGAKSKLKDFLGVDLTQLSKWLTDAPSAREPGAEYALQMKYWVEHPECQ
jgi:transcriptional regulator with XRE-family HTH domain